MEDSEKELVRARTDIVELVSRYTTLKKAGSNYKGCCPFHQEKTPSFNVDPIRGMWRCWGACGEGGDVFSFVMKAEGLTFREAIESLAEKAGVTLTRRGLSPEEAGRQRDERTRLLAANAEAARFFKAMLGRVPTAQAYVRKRGLAHETVEAFGIGFAPNDWSSLSNHLAGRGVAADDAERVGLIYHNAQGYTDRFRGRLMIPIVDVQERIVAFGGRLIEPIENAPKYYNSPETPLFSKSRVLYGLNRARKAIQGADRVLVVEGYMDVIAAHQAGIENVVATLGTALTEEHISLLGRYAKNVILSFDSDNAGIKAALKAAELFTAAGAEFSLRVLALPKGDDPDSILARGDVAGFRRAMDTAVSVPEFRIDALRGGFDLRDENGRLGFLKECVPILAEIASPLDQDLLVRRLAPYHPSFAAGGARAEDAIRLEIQRVRQGGRGLASPATPYSDSPFVDPAPRREWQPRSNGNGNGFRRREWNGRNEPPSHKLTDNSTHPPQIQRRAANEIAERAVLRALLTDAWFRYTFDRLDKVRQLGGTLFQTPRYIALCDALLVLLVGHFSVHQAVNQLQDRELANTASEILFAQEGDEPLTEELIDGCIERLVQAGLRDKERQIYLQETQGDELDAAQLRQWQRSAQARKKGVDPDA